MATKVKNEYDDIVAIDISVDFDGTCVMHEYPRVGRDVPYAESVLKMLRAKGHRLILFTMRSGKELADAVEWFEDRDIELFGVQENPEQSSWTSSPKAYAQAYIGDDAIGCPLILGAHARNYVNWVTIKDLLVTQDIL